LRFLEHTDGAEPKEPDVKIVKNDVRFQPSIKVCVNDSGRCMSRDHLI
jgi:hypothetical protein